MPDQHFHPGDKEEKSQPWVCRCGDYGTDDVCAYPRCHAGRLDKARKSDSAVAWDDNKGEQKSHDTFRWWRLW